MEDATLATPLDDYELLDFGGGRRLERLGALRVERPAPQAEGRPAATGPVVAADWVYGGERVARGQWQGLRDGLPREWSITIAGQSMAVRLAPGGQVGVYPEHVACWRWVAARLAGRPGARVLNLFGASGGASLAALRRGARVTHVDAQGAALALARRNCGEQGVRYLREDALRFVARALRRGERYELIVLDPPSFGRGPGGQAFRLVRDLPELLAGVGGLLAEAPAGLWLSTHTTGWDAARLAEAWRASLPGPAPRSWRLGVATAAGRVLPGGHALTGFEG